MAKGIYKAVEKLTILEEVSNGEIGFLAATKKYEIKKTDTHNRSYSAELKLQAVKDHFRVDCLSTRSSINIRLQVQTSSPSGLRSIVVIAA